MVFPISKCRGDFDLGLYTFGHWHKENRCAVPNSDFSSERNTFFFGNRHCATVFFKQVPKKCTYIDLSLLYVLKLETYSKFARKNNCLALGVCFRRHARALAACLPRQDHVYNTTDKSFRFHNNKFDQMPCKLDFTENPPSFDKYPTPP